MFANTSEDEVGNSASAATLQVGMQQESAPLGLGRLEAPQRYLVQFTATEEYMALYEEAKDLLSHSPGPWTIEAIHLRAMRALVAELKKRKYAVKSRCPAQAQARTPEALDGAAATDVHTDVHVERDEDAHEDVSTEPDVSTQRKKIRPATSSAPAVSQSRQNQDEQLRPQTAGARARQVNGIALKGLRAAQVGTIRQNASS